MDDLSTVNLGFGKEIGFRRTKQRLGLYFFQDRKGIVDRYVTAALRGLREVCGNILIFSAAELEGREREKLAGLGELRIAIPGVHHSFSWAASEICRYGWDQLENWDEMVIMSDDLMGPIRSQSEMFSEMDKREELDFWGLSARSDLGTVGTELEPSAAAEQWVSPSFVVLRRRITQSVVFRKLLEEEAVSGEQASGLQARRLTEKLSSAGFRWDVWAETPEEGLYSSDYLVMDPMDAVQRGKSPFFARTTFTLPRQRCLAESLGEQSWELLRFLKRETDYDTGMILEHLIRTCHQDDILRALRMTYVLSSEVRMKPEASVHSGDQRKNGLSAALVMHLYYTEMLENSLRYARSMPEWAALYILTDGEEKAETIRKVFSGIPNRMEIRVTQNRGRDVGSFLVGAADLQDRFDLICFYHDKKTSHMVPGTVGRSFGYKIDESVLSSRVYAENVIALFEDYPEIGMVSGPMPSHGNYLVLMGNEWADNYESTKALADELGFHVPISREHIPACGLGDVFWYRTAAMRPMFRKAWSYEDFPEEPVQMDGTILHAVERLYPFAVQESGYLPAMVMPEHIAALEMDNLRCYVRGYNRARLDAKIPGNFEEVLQKETERLSPQMLAKANAANMPAQMRLLLKRILPQRLYRGTIFLKRKIFGPRDVPVMQEEELDQMLSSSEKRQTGGKQAHK